MSDQCRMLRGIKMRLRRDLEPRCPHNLHAVSHAHFHLQAPPVSFLLPVGILRREIHFHCSISMCSYGDDEVDCLHRKPQVQGMLLI